MITLAVASLVLVIPGAVLVVTSFGPGAARRREPDPDALNILERRYAAGGIDRDEVEGRRAVLVT